MKNFIATLFFAFISISCLAQFNKGNKVLINYQEQWYPGKILEVKSQNTFLVSYDDYDASWNEVVSSDRLKSNELKTDEPSNSSLKSSKGNMTIIGEKKAADMCECLNKMMITQKQEDKSKCLKLQEEHVAALGKGSEDYYAYQKKVSQCEQELSKSKTDASQVKGKNPITYEEKVIAICDCFKEARTNRGQTMECFKRQDEYSKSVGNKKTAFIQETNMCQ